MQQKCSNAQYCDNWKEVHFDGNTEHTLQTQQLQFVLRVVIYDWAKTRPAAAAEFREIARRYLHVTPTRRNNANAIY